MESERFGRYQTVRLLGSGAMGAVYLARDELLGRDVAIKTIRAQALSGVAAELFRARFMNEARAVASLGHPNVVRVFDLGFERETPYLVMEVVGGTSLQAGLQARGRLSATEARVLGVQLARALQAAHAVGILHRDVKPANVLESEAGLWKLADFGVAHVPDSSLTMSGQFLGSPAYAAPEALESGEFGPASDVYGLGATLYEALTGEPPYGRRGVFSVAMLAAKGGPRPIAELNPEIPWDLAAAIMATLARDPTLRPTASGLAETLASSSPGLPAAPVPQVVPPRRRVDRRLVIGGVAVAALLLLGVVLGSSGSDRGDRGTPGMGGFPAAQPAVWSTPGGRDRDKHEEKRWRKIQDKLSDGDFESAESELRKLLERNPDDQEAHELLERIRLERRQRGHED